ncbi:MAG: rod shape-determining protein MreD [Rickettsiales bacterium]|jgi:rod shape-determining protein MreD
MVINYKNIFIIQIIAVFFAIFNLSSINIDSVADYLPLFDVMIIYYFAVLRKDIYPVWLLFILGLICDSINGFPLGMTSIIYIVAVKSFNAFNQRASFEQNFRQIFIQFIAFLSLIMICKWIILSLYDLKFYNFLNPLIQIIITSLFYIFMHRFFNYLDTKLLQK